MDDGALVAELCYLFNIDPAALTEEARKRDVPAREIIAGFTRTLAYLRIQGVEGAAEAPITELDALPPGTLDKRIVFNDMIWIDIFRRSHQISTMDAGHVHAVIEMLRRRAPELYELGPGGGDILEWLETTPLLHALRHHLEALTPSGLADAAQYGPLPDPRRAAGPDEQEEATGPAGGELTPTQRSELMDKLALDHPEIFDRDELWEWPE